MAINPGITDLEEIVGSLPDKEKALFRRLYAVTTTIGKLRPPEKLKPWVKEKFGSLEAVTRQKIVKLTNKITYEGVLFNELRASRPHPPPNKEGIEARLEEARRDDLFSSPQEGTPEDIFGRVEGKYCVTASNIAKNDGLHGVIIFNDFDPLIFSKEQVIDYIDTGWEWAKRAQTKNPEAKYFLFFWNCLWRAGASIVHGHAQVMLTADMHYAKVEGLRCAALGYKEAYGSNYFEDLFKVHHSLGCAVEKGGVRILTYLTPFKYNEVILMAKELNLALKKGIYEVLACFKDRLGVTSFNVGLVTPPLAPTQESWEGFPVMARIVDRGDPESSFSEVGGAEIFAASIVPNDPFKLARELWEHLG